MAAAGEKAKSTIVIKRIKKGGHGGHSAAWKIAYADFVTAMMAFFLLMWLLGSTTKGDLKGIADYFNSPLQVAMLGGSGSGDATSVIPGGGEDLTRSAGQVKKGSPEEKKKRRAELQKVERKRMEKLKERIDAAVLTNAKLSEYKNQIRIEITPDGLRVQIVDDFNRPMFALGSAQVQPYMRDILQEIGKVLNDVDSKVALSGHTDSAQYAAGERGYSNWELSADRANASRRELIVGGMQAGKIVRVVGLADSHPLDKDDTRNPLNRRISIIVMNKLAEERMNEAKGEIEAGTPQEVEDAVGSGQATAGATATPAATSAEPGAGPSAEPAAAPSSSATQAPVSSAAAPGASTAAAPVATAVPN